MDFDVMVIKVGDGVLYFGNHYHINGFVYIWICGQLFIFTIPSL